MQDKIGCVLIHGFTGSPKEIEILAENLKKKGFDVSTPVLKGHGREINRTELKQASWTDWVDSAEVAVKEMVKTHEEVYLIGFSMGGLISAYLASKYPIKKLVLLSTSVFYINPTKMIADLRQNPLSKDDLRRYFMKIRRTPIIAAFQFRKLVKNLVSSIEKVNVPTLIIQGEKDDLVDPKSAQYIYDSIQAKEKHIHYLPNSKHLVCLDCERDRVVELVNLFLFDNIHISKL